MDYLKLAIELAHTLEPEPIDCCLMCGDDATDEHYPYCSLECGLIADIESEDE